MSSSKRFLVAGAAALAAFLVFGSVAVRGAAPPRAAQESGGPRAADGEQGQRDRAGEPSAVVPNETEADPGPSAGGTLFYNGRIYLGAEIDRVVEAVLVVGGRVYDYGASARFQRNRAWRTWSRVDLNGAFVVPGLQDSHVDLEAFCEHRDALDLSQAKSYADLIARVQERASETKAGTWIRGYGWDSSAWPDVAGDFPNHRALSEKVPDHPVFLEHAQGNVVLVNEHVLHHSKLDGEVLVDKKLVGRVLVDDQRRATGIFIDKAVDLVAGYPETKPADLRRQFLEVQDLFLARGVTCVHDMGTSRRFLELLGEVRDAGELRLRVVCYLDGEEGVEPKELRKLARLSDGALLSVAGVSIALDGALFTRSAALVRPYADRKSEHGVLFLNRDQLAAKISDVAHASLQPAVHAIGDGANHLVLDVYRGLMGAIEGFEALRPRIEHARIVSTEDWPQFPLHGIVASMLPLAADADARWMLARLGLERTRSANDWRGLTADMGPLPSRLAFGSGAPLHDHDPMKNFRAAMVRVSAGEDVPDAEDSEPELSNRAVLNALTRGAAFATREEVERGALLKGFWADLTVLDVDLLHAAPDEIAAARVFMTVVDGRTFRVVEGCVQPAAGRVPGLQK